MCRLQRPVGEVGIRVGNASATTFIHTCFCCVAVYKPILCPASIPAWRNDERTKDTRLYRRTFGLQDKSELSDNNGSRDQAPA
ncbi:hypothetical protein SAMN05216411_10544 [Nitrosospira multiformis]|nr:hypothetical protein SAMN05216411_10544 [Nitrosospira multiformis]